MQPSRADSVIHATPVLHPPFVEALLNDTLAALSPHRRHTAILIRNVNTLLHALVRFRGIDDPFLDVRRQAVERLFDVDIALG